jgi:hypothetical protein
MEGVALVGSADKMELLVGSHSICRSSGRSFVWRRGRAQFLIENGRDTVVSSSYSSSTSWLLRRLLHQ